MAQNHYPAGGPTAVIDPRDPEGRQAAFETLLRSPRLEEHRNRVRIDVEHWSPRREAPPSWITRLAGILSSSARERNPVDGAHFRREISAHVLECALHYSRLYYQAFLPDGCAAVRRSRASIITTAKGAANLVGKLSIAVRQLWQSDDPAVRQILLPLADQYPRGDALGTLRVDDPGFVTTLEDLRLRVELIATALPTDVGGRRSSVLFEELTVRLAGIYSAITGEPALTSTRAGAPEGRFFHFVKAVIAWLRAAAAEFPDVTLDLPPSDDALRMVLRRLANPRPTAESNSATRQPNDGVDPKLLFEGREEEWLYQAIADTLRKVRTQRDSTANRPLPRESNRT